MSYLTFNMDKVNANILQVIKETARLAYEQGQIDKHRQICSYVAEHSDTTALEIWEECPNKVKDIALLLIGMDSRYNCFRDLDKEKKCT